MTQTDPISAEDQDRHAAKMARKKAARDRMMETKTGEKGLIIVHTGPGKGKSSSGFGMILRSLAHGMPCAVVQFIKGAMATGEKAVFDRFPDLIELKPMGEGFTLDTQDSSRDIDTRVASSPKIGSPTARKARANSSMSRSAGT